MEKRRAWEIVKEGNFPEVRLRAKLWLRETTCGGEEAERT